MNHLLKYCLFSFFIFPLFVHSQEFAPKGATWVYQNLRPENTFFPTLIRFTATRDTVLNERIGRIIEKEYLYYDGFWEPDGDEIVSSSGDSVFVYYKDEFKLIFDFTSEVGDTVFVLDKPFEGFLFSNDRYPFDFTHLQYRIDSVNTIIYGQDTFKNQFVSYLENPYDSLLQWGFQNTVALAQSPPLLGRILQGIGSLGFDTPLGTSVDISYPIDFGIEQLTCYSDSLRTINFSGVDCDSLIALYDKPNSISEKEIDQIEVFPNPFSTLLNIKNPTTNNDEVFIYDINGVLVTKLKGGRDTYNLSFIETGTYMIRITSDSQIYRALKIIKF